MHIQFHSVSYKNFLSTGNAPTVIDLTKTSKTLIIGNNGDGKSTVLDALHFVLFGSAFRDINKGLLVNTINGKQCVVEVTFSVAGYDYRVVRGISPNVFDIYKGGDLLPHDANVRDYQKRLEENILGGLSSKLFRQIVVLGAANYVPFMQLTPADRRNVVENMLDMNVFSSMGMMYKDYVKDVRSREISCQSKQAALQASLEKYEAWLANHERIEEEKRLARDKRIADEQKLLDDAKLMLDRIELDHVTYKPVDDLRAELQNKQSKIMEKKGRHSVNKSRLEEELVFFSHHDVCPTCQQAIDEKFKASKIDAIKKDCDAINNELATVSSLQKILDAKMKEVRDADQEQRRYDQQHNSILMTIRQHETRIASLQETKNDSTQPDSDQFVSLVESTRKELRDVNAELNSVLLESEACKTLALMLKDSGIKATMIKQYVPMINELINKYLEQLNFFVQFTIDEEFNEVIKSRYRDTFSYNSFSQGEKLRIDVAILFAWRALLRSRNGVTANILIMDEILDGSIDNSGAEDFLHLLDDVAKKSNIFIISHRGDALADKFERVLKFEKEMNYSTMSEAM